MRFTLSFIQKSIFNPPGRKHGQVCAPAGFRADQKHWLKARQRQIANESA